MKFWIKYFFSFLFLVAIGVISLNAQFQNLGTDIQQNESAEFSSVQDSAFTKAMKLHIPVLCRLKRDLNLSQDEWNLQKEISKGTPWQIAIDNIKNIPRKMFAPDPVEATHRHQNIVDAMHVPFVNTYSPFGMKVSFGDIGKLLGLVQDVSPKFTYTIDYKTKVEVVIYSIQAIVVSTIFSGEQNAGTYTLHWNGRNDKGKKMPPGDYIGEIRIGKERYLRKRVIIFE